MATNAEQSQLKKANAGDTGGSVVTPSTGASQAPDAGQSRVANYSTGSAMAPSSQGSGRFTNISKYINANQGAGEQLGGKITGDVSKNLSKTDKEQTTAASNIATNIQAEKDRLAKASGYNTQLQDQTANGAQAINNDATQKTEFSNLLNNQNVAGTLATNAQTAADTAQSAYNNLGQQVNNLGTEQGRFALLQQAVKNPQYTQGQQRLDQLFLQASNPNQLVQAQRDLNKQLGTSQTNIGDQYGTFATDITGLGTQAADVSNQLRNTLNTQTSNLTDAQIAEAQNLNTNNAASNAALQTYFTNGYGSLTADQKALIDPMLASSGLTSGQRTYNVLNNGAYNNYLNTGSTNLTGADVLDQGEYDRYAALQSLAGIDPSQNLYTQAGSGGTQAGIKGQQLNADISAAQEALLNSLNTTGTASANGALGNSTATANLQDLLRLLEGQRFGSGNIQNGSSVVNSQLAPITATNANSGFGNVTNVGLGTVGAGYENMAAQGLGNQYFTGNASQRDAAMNLWNNFYNNLMNQGYGNTLGGVGPLGGVLYNNGDTTFK